MRQLRVPRTIRVRIWAEYNVYTSKRDVQKQNYTKETKKMCQLRVPRTIRVRIWAEYDVYTSKRDVQKQNYTKETEKMCQLRVPRTIHTILVREQNVTYTRHKQTYNHRPTHRWVLSKKKNVKSIAFYLCHIFSWVGSSAECAALMSPGYMAFPEYTSLFRYIGLFSDMCGDMASCTHSPKSALQSF